MRWRRGRRRRDIGGGKLGSLGGSARCIVPGLYYLLRISSASIFSFLLAAPVAALGWRHGCLLPRSLGARFLLACCRLLLLLLLLALARLLLIVLPALLCALRLGARIFLLRLLLRLPGLRLL